MIQRAAMSAVTPSLTGRRPKWVASMSCLKRRLQAAINRFLADTNENPNPFVWTAAPDKVLADVKRGKQALESVH
jgi:hypothetical protein